LSLRAQVVQLVLHLITPGCQGQRFFIGNESIVPENAAPKGLQQTETEDASQVAARFIIVQTSQEP